MKWKFNKQVFIVTVSLIILGILGSLLVKKGVVSEKFDTTDPVFWKIRSIDTVKYSRDVAREKLNDETYEIVIAEQVKNIADAGASHVAVGTPYDEEFVPFLKKWINEARKNNLKVWFRGNFSGWEGWFGYDQISKEEHLKMSVEFIINNPELFEDGDIFTACTECENGALGDPRHTGEVKVYQDFLINLYKENTKAFHIIGKDVAANYFSMNGDVAKLIMDKETTHKLGGIVVVDHYVYSVDKLIIDLKNLADQSGGLIVLGEVGAPISDIHGHMSEGEQADWVNNLLRELTEVNEVVGINYWTNIGSSTAAWNDDGSSRELVEVLRQYYNPKVVSGKIVDNDEDGVAGVQIIIGNNIYQSMGSGDFKIICTTKSKANLVKEGYLSREIEFMCDSSQEPQIVMEKEKTGIFENLRKRLDLL